MAFLPTRYSCEFPVFGDADIDGSDTICYNWLQKLQNRFGGFPMISTHCQLRLRLLSAVFALCVLLSCAPSVLADDGTLIAGIATVYDASSLRMHDAPSTNSPVIDTAESGTMVLVLEQVNENWYLVRYDGRDGYMYASYLKFQAVADVDLGSGTVTEESVNVRSVPAVTGAPIAQLTRGETVQITGINHGWYKVVLLGKTGYIRSDLIALSDASAPLPADGRSQDSSSTASDISGHWASSYISQVLSSGWMETYNGRFNPEGVMTRAMFVSALGHMAGVDSSASGVSPYSDVPATAEYLSCAVWASNAGVMNGDGDGSFRPGDGITREQTASVLIRYADAVGQIYTEAENPVTSYNDWDAVSDWAKPYVESLSKYGILSGYPNGCFYPLNTLTRAQAATILCSMQRSLHSAAPAKALTSAPSGDLTYPGESYEDKCLRLFGQDVPRRTNWSYDEVKHFFTSEEDAKACMTEITVPVNTVSGGKSTIHFKVHSALAASFQQVFEEIYETGFPIVSIAGFRYEPGSEHCIGTAVDVNWLQNPYYSKSYLRGEFTDEELAELAQSPLFIPIGGEIEKIFEKYGFTRGFWKTGTDFMHFSYFGT